MFVVDYLITIALGIAVVPGGSLDAPVDRLGAGVAVKASEIQAESARPLDEDAGDRSTAEELLRALQRQRPVNRVIPPASRSEGDRQPVRRPLLPEGSTMVSRSGWLRRDAHWWTFVFDPADGEPPTKLLPNAKLEVMVRTAGGSAGPVKFIMSGDVTVFMNENYLLVRDARRLLGAHPSPKHKSGVSKQVAGAIPAAGQTPARATGTTDLSADTPVEDVLAALQEQRPRAEVMPVAPPASGDRPGRGATAARTLLPDGSALVHRPGRLIRDGSWWTFALESDHPDHPEPPMKVLPNQSVELMLEASKRDDHGLVFLVSGEVTLFEGENFLLPTIAMRRIDTGNLRK